MRLTCLRCGFAALLALAALSEPARAQWTDAGWTHTKVSSSASGYVINTSTPGVSAAAPSAGLTHTWITESYSDVLSANGSPNNADIGWTLSLSGTVTGAYSAASSFDWPNGTRSDGITTAGSYSLGPLDPGADTYVSPPGGTVNVSCSADAQNDQYYPNSTATASASGNGTIK